MSTFCILQIFAITDVITLIGNIEFKDVRKSDISFIRTISDQRYTFEKNKLISTEILSTSSNVFIYPLHEDTNSILINPFYITHNKDRVLTPLNLNSTTILNNE